MSPIEQPDAVNAALERLARGSVGLAPKKSHAAA